jgi:hypothetical protein
MSDTITQLARPPFQRAERGHVRDATGSLVITCDDEILCMLFSEREVDKDGHFMCPKCGRLGQRMVEARPAQCGLTDSSPAVDRAAHGSGKLRQEPTVERHAARSGVGGRP